MHAAAWTVRAAECSLLNSPPIRCWNIPPEFKKTNGRSPYSSRAAKKDPMSPTEMGGTVGKVALAELTAHWRHEHSVAPDHFCGEFVLIVAHPGMDALPDDLSTTRMYMNERVLRSQS